MKKFTNKMKNFWSLAQKTNSGFTLVELIVVIAILAILAGVAVPAYSGYVEKANKQADQTLVSDIINAGTVYYYGEAVSGSDNPAGSVLGYVIATEEGITADDGMEAAMVAAFGESYEANALEWDGWDGAADSLRNVSSVIADSSYITAGADALLGDVQYCSSSLAKFLSGVWVGKDGAEKLDGVLGNGSYVTDYLKNYKDEEITGEVLGNAVVFGLANSLSDDSTEATEKFMNGYYLLRNWNNALTAEFIPGGYKDNQSLNNYSDGSILLEVANTYAALEAFSSYMGIPLELEFDPNDTKGKIITDVENECQRVLDEALVKDSAKMLEYIIGNGGETPQAAKDAEAYLSVMKSVNDLKGDYQDKLNNTSLFDNQDMTNRVNGYMAVSSMDESTRSDLLQNLEDAGSAIAMVFTVAGDGVLGCTVYAPSADPRY